VQLASRHGDRGGGDDDDNTPRRFLTGPGVCRRYNITDMALWRWLNDAELQFPRPTLVVKGRRYWLESELQNWERSPSARQTQRRNKPPQRR
jgi:predicted DNA-binding transcriptional regulator AlpA